MKKNIKTGDYTFKSLCTTPLLCINKLFFEIHFDNEKKIKTGDYTFKSLCTTPLLCINFTA